MKKLSIALILILSLALGLAAPTLAAPSEIFVFVNGVRLELDVKPVLTNGRTLVPFRAIFEKLGYSVVWNAGTQQATATKSDRTIIMRANSKQATVNGETKTLDVAATVKNGRFLVPLRFVGEASGYNVLWDNATRCVFVGTTLKMYSDYTTVPDFGSYTGIALLYKIESEYGVLYVYPLSPVTSSVQTKYTDLLVQYSFISQGRRTIEGTSVLLFTKANVGVGLASFPDTFAIMLVKAQQ